MTTCSTIGAHATGTLTIHNSEARTVIGEIHSAEQPNGTYAWSAYYLDIDQNMQSCGEYVSSCRAIQEVRDRRFQATSAWLRERKAS